jgi:hypothetical protein
MFAKSIHTAIIYSIFLGNQFTEHFAKTEGLVIDFKCPLEMFANKCKIQFIFSFHGTDFIHTRRMSTGQQYQSSFAAKSCINANVWEFTNSTNVKSIVGDFEKGSKTSVRIKGINMLDGKFFPIKSIVISSDTHPKDVLPKVSLVFSYKKQ